MAQVEKKQTAAEALIYGPLLDPDAEHPWPTGAHLIPADRDWAGDAVVRAVDMGHQVVLFFPDGRQILLTPSTLNDEK